MKIELVDIPVVPPEWQSMHQVKALVVDGRAPVLEALVEWRKRAPEDYRKILKVICLLTANDRVRNPRHVKKDRRGEVYEMRADQGHARLFFFYSADRRQVVICTNEYWKTKSSAAEQERAFQRARDLKALYESRRS